MCPGAPSGHWSISALAPCLAGSLSHACAFMLGLGRWRGARGNQGASQGLMLQPSLSLTSSKQKPLCPLHGLWGPCPYFRTKHGCFGKRRTKIGMGGTLSGSGQEACPRVTQDRCAWQWQSTLQVGEVAPGPCLCLPLCSSLGFRCYHRGFLVSLLPTLPNLSLPSALKINYLFITVLGLTCGVQASLWLRGTDSVAPSHVGA